MQELLKDKVVLVTGGSQGLGLAIAQAAAREGARGVAIVGRHGDKLATAERSLGEFAAETFSVVADLEAPGEAERVVAETVNTFGQIDSLVNAAGVTTAVSRTSLRMWPPRPDWPRQPRTLPTRTGGTGSVSMG